MKSLINVILSLFVIANSFVTHAQRSDFGLSKYHLKISEENLRLVEVNASLMLQEPYLEMNPWGIPPEIPMGWAKFVDITSITDQNGQKISYQWIDSLQRWQLDIANNSQIDINYQVRLEHDNYDWYAGGGIDGRPTVWNDQTIFWVTKGLFLYCYGDDTPKPSRVTFDVPQNWTISTAWIQTEKREYHTNSIDELDNNLLVIGQHEEKVISLDNMSITIATPSNFKHRLPLLEKNLKKILPLYRNIFGELPKINYLVCASQNTVEDGEAYQSSFHQMFIDKDLDQRKIVWANTLAHEMFHYWNGLNVLYSNDVAANAWFAEGFTDYYSSLALVRAGIISKQDYLHRLGFQFARFYGSQQLNASKISLAEAGKEKLKNWHLIYGGGASMAFIWDVEIRAKTNGKKSLDDFMRVLYEKYGKDKKPISLEIQLKELNQLTGGDFTPIFENYITGNENALALIIQTCEKAGLTIAYYQLEVYLKPKKDKDRSIYRSIITAK